MGVIRPAKFVGNRIRVHKFFDVAFYFVAAPTLLFELFNGWLEEYGVMVDKSSRGGSFTPRWDNRARVVNLMGPARWRAWRAIIRVRGTA